MMARNSAFGAWSERAGEEAGQPTAVPAPGWAGLAAVPPAQDMLSQLNVAGFKNTSRNRSWEQAHRGKSYRGIPQSLQDSLKAIAGDRERSVDVIAGAFLEYALVCYRRGDLSLDPILDAGRRTVLHTNGCVWEERVWGTNSAPETPRRKRKTASPTWRRVVTYRLPGEVIATIRQFADQLEVPVGEIVTYLLAHSLDAYRAGRLVIHPGEG